MMPRARTHTRARARWTREVRAYRDHTGRRVVVIYRDGAARVAGDRNRIDVGYVPIELPPDDEWVLHPDS